MKNLLNGICCDNMRYLSNTALIKKCAESLDNQKAWFEFIKRFDRHIKLSVLRAYKLISINLLERKISKEDIRDLVQEVYFRLVKNGCKALKTFEPKYDHAFYGYLAKISVSVVKDFFKKFSTLKRRVYIESIDEQPANSQTNTLITKSMPSFIESNPEKRIIAKDLLQKVKSHFNSGHSTKENRRKELLFQLYFIHGLSIKDISRIKGLNISHSNANVIIWRMKKEIRSLVYNDSLTPKGI
ncbi:MAG: sigma-70 family RNA polymerase sigma factor [Candidatus Aminicenantes bacterium]|nr:sigma-70 family RNA polymerase sigma factor [Candidatus Aminicenantes bacterium]